MLRYLDDCDDSAAVHLVAYWHKADIPTPQPMSAFGGIADIMNASADRTI